MSTKQDRNIAKADECEKKAKEALDRSVTRYFTKLARDYRRLAELTEGPSAYFDDLNPAAARTAGRSLATPRV